MFVFRVVLGELLEKAGFDYIGRNKTFKFLDLAVVTNEHCKIPTPTLSEKVACLHFQSLLGEPGVSLTRLC